MRCTAVLIIAVGPPVTPSVKAVEVEVKYEYLKCVVTLPLDHEEHKTWVPGKGYVIWARA